MMRSVELSVIPSDFSVNYLNETLTLRAKQQGYRYYNEGYFHYVAVFMDSVGKVTVSGKCYRSQRKTEKPHSLHLDIGESRIMFSLCSCQAGMCGSCSHIVGLVQALSQWQLMGFTNIPADLSSTSLPQQWNKPRGTKIQAEAVATLKFVNPKPDRKKVPVQNQLHDCRKIKVQPEDLAPLQSMCGTAISYLVSSPSQSVDTHVGTVPIGSGLATHAKFYVVNRQQPVTTACGDLTLPKVSPLVPETDNLSIEDVSMAHCIEIEEKTRDQAENPLWFRERTNRLTASQFGQIIKRKIVSEKFVASVKTPKPFTSSATAYGKANESKGLTKYRERTGNHTHKCGLVINPSFPFLGASPDGKVCVNDACGLVEVKCPYAARDKTLKEACLNRDFCLEEKPEGMRLKKSHNYFYQVQGQMLVSGTKFCDFVVYTRKDLHVEKIEFDQTFCQQLLNQLYELYNKYYK